MHIFALAENAWDQVVPSVLYVLQLGIAPGWQRILHVRSLEDRRREGLGFIAPLRSSLLGATPRLQGLERHHESLAI